MGLIPFPFSDYFWKGPRDLLDRAGKDVDAADDHYVVGAAQNAPFEQREMIPLVAAEPRPHDIARAIAYDGTAEAAGDKIGDKIGTC